MEHGTFATDEELLSLSMHKLHDVLEAIDEGTWACPDKEWKADLMTLKAELLKRVRNGKRVKTPTMPMAIWVDCPGVRNDGKQAHYMRDNCWSCAPFWEQIPICPECKGKLLKVGRTKCKTCQKFVMVGPRPELDSTL